MITEWSGAQLILDLAEDVSKGIDIMKEKAITEALKKGYKSILIKVEKNYDAEINRIVCRLRYTECTISTNLSEFKGYELYTLTTKKEE